MAVSAFREPKERKNSGRPEVLLTSSVIFDQNALLTYLVLPWSLITSLPNFLFTLSCRCSRLPELELKLYGDGLPSPGSSGEP